MWPEVVMENHTRSSAVHGKSHTRSTTRPWKSIQGPKKNWHMSRDTRRTMERFFLLSDPTNKPLWNGLFCRISFKTGNGLFCNYSCNLCHQNFPTALWKDKQPWGNLQQRKGNSKQKLSFSYRCFFHSVKQGTYTPTHIKFPGTRLYIREWQTH